MKIWIDADATPREVTDFVFRAAKRLGIPTIMVANQFLLAPGNNPMVTAVRVDRGADAADAHIGDAALPGDLVVTQDIPLASILIAKGVIVLDPRGEEHTAETIGERLSIRNFMEQARISGMITGGPPPFDARATQAFGGALDRALTRLRLWSGRPLRPPGASPRKPGKGKPRRPTHDSSIAGREGRVVATSR